MICLSLISISISITTHGPPSIYRSCTVFDRYFTLLYSSPPLINELTSETHAHAQGDQLRKLGLPFAAHLDRTSPTPLATKQCFFIDTYALPLFRLIAQVLPETKAFLDACLETRANWLASQAADSTPTSSS